VLALTRKPVTPLLSTSAGQAMLSALDRTSSERNRSMTTGKHLPDMAGAIGGVAFAALLFFAVASFNPLKEASDAELASWWADSGNLRGNVISMYLMLGSVPFFLLFLATLRGRLVLAGDDSISTFVMSAGLCFCAALLVGGVARGLIAQSVKIGDEPLPGPDTLRYVTAFARTMFLLVSMPAAAITVGAAAWGVIRARALASWVGWSGLLVAGVIAVTTPLFVAPLTLPLLLLWIVATSIEIWRTQSAPAPAAASAASRVSAPAR
jgi:hypothetical protein